MRLHPAMRSSLKSCCQSQPRIVPRLCQLVMGCDGCVMLPRATVMALPYSPGRDGLSFHCKPRAKSLLLPEFGELAVRPPTQHFAPLPTLNMAKHSLSPTDYDWKSHAPCPACSSPQVGC